MQIEEFASNELCTKVRNRVKEMLDDLDFKHEFQKDRLLVDITREILLAKF